MSQFCTAFAFLEEARRLAETNEAVRALYDPRNPGRILWAESLLTELPDSGA